MMERWLFNVLFSLTFNVIFSWDPNDCISPKECPGYDIKQCNGEAPVLEF